MPREVKPFVQCHIKIQLKPRTDQFLKSSEAQTPHLNSLRALPSHHITAIPIWLESHFSQKSVDRHSKWFTPLHLTAVLLLITFPDMQTCPRPVSYTAINPVHLCTYAGSCWFFSMITWTHHNFVNSPVQQSFNCLTAQTKPWATMDCISYIPLFHCTWSSHSQHKATVTHWPPKSYLNLREVVLGVIWGMSQSFGLREHVQHWTVTYWIGSPEAHKQICFL